MLVTESLISLWCSYHCKNDKNRVNIKKLDSRAVDGIMTSALWVDRKLNKNNTSGTRWSHMTK